MSTLFYRFVTIFSIIALLVAFGISVAGAVVSNSTNRYQPAAEIFAYSAAIIGIFAERLARQSEARQQTISSIAAELKANEAILLDKAFAVDGANAGRPYVYPRLRISAVEDAFANTRVSFLNDADLVERLREWRDKLSDFNRRLDITELRGFTVADATERGDMQPLTKIVHRCIISSGSSGVAYAQPPQADPSPVFNGGKGTHRLRSLIVV